MTLARVFRVVTIFPFLVLDQRGEEGKKSGEIKSLKPNKREGEKTDKLCCRDVI